jgi:Domain of unknown function (DUF4166)
MFVEVEGTDGTGAPARRSWHLLAEGNDGPFIPSMAVEALVRKTLDGHPPAPGARAALFDLELEDYEELFAGRALYTGVRDEIATETRPLYARILGSAWDDLPAEIREMHDVEGMAVAEGRAMVERGRSPLARLAALLIGFPREAAGTRVKVRFVEADGVETWIRTFGTQTFSSRQFAGRGRSDRLICERFGPLTFAFALVARNRRLELVLRRWSAFGIPLPLWLSPRSSAFETSEGGLFRFHVKIWHPLTGLIVRYEGWLERPIR